MFSATPAGTSCPPGTQPVIGWDGAPKWATITDGGTTCLAPGDQRESAPAVQQAFAHFYADTDGIADELTAVWSTLAGEFAGVAGVAGYDLLNEPNWVQPVEQNQVAYNQWVQHTIDAIRAAESQHDPSAHKPVFAEPLQLYPLPNNALLPQYVHDDNLVFAPHNYAESIYEALTVEQGFSIEQQSADELGAALWTGEYGWWGTEPHALTAATHFAAQEDRRVAGGTWWQWRQTCGDPHSVGGPGIPATADQVHLITRACSPASGAPRDTDLRYTEEFLRILGRPYPRVAPGHITSLQSDPTTGTLTVSGADAAHAGELVVWLPTVKGAGARKATVTDGLDAVSFHTVSGGQVLTARATAADWTLSVS
jgi:endoglycosylceramidase